MTDDHDELDPIDPRTARELFVDQEEGERTDSTELTTV